MNEKEKFPIFIGINGRMANCSSGLLGVIVRNTFHFIPVVPLLALKMKKDLSTIVVGLVQPRKAWESLGIAWAKSSRKEKPFFGFEPRT